MRPVPPEIVALHGPEHIGQDTAAVFTARINDEATEPVRLLWDFGNGYEDRGLRVRHVFTTEGSHTVRFRVENERGHDMRTWMLRVGNLPRAPQIATVQVQPNPARVGERVHYETRVDGAAPTRYRWTFGDGAQSEEAAPTHRYEAHGTYAVRVRVEHATGTDARTVQIEVEPDLPDFCAPPVAGNVVYFARNASVLPDAASEALRENVSLFRDCAPLPIRVLGYATADERNANALAADRAAAVVAAYRAAGVAAERLQATHHVELARRAGKTPKSGFVQGQRVDSSLQRRASGE
ncbi:PKD domain-containing protein [Longimonas halophila]|nr:PKD domain-containing protein [Longimonas halophila]